MANISVANIAHAPIYNRLAWRSVQRSVNTTLLLMIFMIVFIVILLLISALNLQRAVSADVDETITATVGQVRLDIQTLNDLDITEDRLSKEIAAVKSDAADNDAKMDGTLESVVSLIRRHAIQNPQIPSALIALPGFDNVQDNQLRLNERIELYKQKVAADADKATVTPVMLGKYFVGLESDLLPVMNVFFPARDRWRDDERQRKSLEDEMAAIVAPPKDAAVNRLANESYRTVVEDFRTFERLVGQRLFGVVLIPNPVLVLLLAVFMGMLGSLIHLSRRLVIEREPLEANEMFYRIGLGAAVALALFFFASAGVLTLSQSSSGKVDTNMSPYLISFLGITAGFLSERTTAWMKEVGEKTFKLEAGQEPPRWAIGLDTALGQDFAPAALAGATGVTPAEVESWIARTKPVPGDKQALVAAFLRMHPSKLFTDIQPG